MRNIIGIISILLFLTGIIFSFYSVYQLDCDINGHWKRSVTSANAELMNEHFGKVIQGFEDKGFTTGHTVWFFKNPGTDLESIYKQLLDFRSRIQVISEMDDSSFEYQKALEEVTESMERQQLSYSLWWCRYYGHLWIGLIVLGIIGGFVILIGDTEQVW